MSEATNSTTTAKKLIQEQVSSMLVQPLEAASVVLAAGPHIENCSGPLRFNRLDKGFTASWVAENEEIPDGGAASFGEIQLMPTSRKGIKSIIRVSNELIRQGNVAAVSTVFQQRLVADVANALDTALLSGDGSGDTITGILNQPEVTSAEFSTSEVDTFLDALALAASKEVTPNRWLMSGSDFFALRKLKDANGRYLMQQAVADDVAYRLFNIPVTVSNKIPAGKAILADMRQIVVVRDIDPTVTILTERYAEFDQIGIRVATRYDLGLLHPEGVIVMSDGTE